MDSGDYVFDTVKFEKMRAMARYNRFMKLKKLLKVLEVLGVVTLISWSSTYLPQALKVSGNFCFQLADFVFRPYVVFLIGNVIIIALVLLRRENDASGDCHNSDPGDLYDDYVRHSQDPRQRKDVSIADPSPTSPVTKQICSGGEIEAEEKQVVHVAPVEEKEEEEKSSAVVTTIADATKEIQKFQRTQSARLKRETAVMPRLELRRSETSRRDAATSFDSVDSLSNEDFNLAVASFIRRHQDFLLQQKLAENEEL